MRYAVGTGEETFLGSGNYVSLLNDSLFWIALRNTFIFTSVCVSVEFVIGLGLALLLNRDLRDRGLIRTLLILPMMITPVVEGLQFRFIFTDQIGILNHILKIFGIEGPLWIADSNVALISVMIAMIWCATPFDMLVLLAGLKSVPPDLYDAAKVDGVSRWQSFRYVSWPLLKPAALIVLLIRTMDAFRTFDIIYIITGAGPAHATELISTYAYRIAFSHLDFGEASALSCIALLIISAISLCYVLLLRVGKE